MLMSCAKKCQFVMSSEVSTDIGQAVFSMPAMRQETWCILLRGDDGKPCQTLGPFTHWHDFKYSEE